MWFGKTHCPPLFPAQVLERQALHQVWGGFHVMAKTVNCPVCGKTFSTSAGLRIHLVQSHSKKRK